MSLLLDSIRRTAPARLALADERRQLTYGALATALAEEMRWLEASGGRRFGLLADNGVPWALADLALHESRRPNVPLPACFTAAQLTHAIRDTGIDALLTDRPELVADLCPRFAPAGRSARTGLVLLRDRSAVEEAPPLPAPGIAKITYTSGSTAAPKGVCLTAETLERVALSLASVTAPLAIARHLCLMPLPTLLENLAGLYVPLLCGATCLLPATAATGMSFGGLDAPRLLAAIAAAQPESLILVPELLRLIVAASARGWRTPRSLKLIAVGGATVSRELLEQARDCALPVYEGYGLSECASVVCLNTPRAERIGSVGRPLPHARVRIDRRGEIHVRGATMAGYLGEAPRAAGAPSRPGRAQEDAEIASGDLGEIDAEGYVYVRGRLRNLFITSLGRNVSPEWVEAELLQEPAIRQALVQGESLPFAVALVQPAHPGSDDEALASAVERANARLPDYARVRRWARFPQPPSAANGLLTANGRLRRSELLARHARLIESLAATRPIELRFEPV